MTLVIGHRGASKISPENTLLAFKRAIELGADYVEFDVQQSKDKVLVVTHDENLSRLTGFDGLVKSLTLNELKKLDFGEGQSIPTFEELILLTKGKIRLNCEIKVANIAKKVVNIIKKYDIVDSTIISSFLHDELLNVKKIEPKIKIASLVPNFQNVKLDWKEKKKMIQFCVLNHFYAINPIVMMVDRQFVDYSHAKNIKVFPWTVDLKIMIKKLLRIGVDGIITNDIELVKKIIETK